MRLIVVLLTTAILQVSASSYGQNVTLKQTNTSLVSVFTEIRKQTGYDFFYSDKMMDSANPISVDLKNAPIEEALKQIFAKQPLEYELKNNSVLVRPKEPTFLERLAERWASIDVSGRVLDADGRGLPGASVSVKGKGGKAVSTGANGNFYLKGVDEDAMLVISFIGYVPKEVKAAKELGDIALELSNSKLDEVQVIAYGTTTQRLSTGNVATIKADVIEKQPVNNPLLALQGRVPGLFIEQATGFAGTAVKVRIQGTNSMFNGNDPLYVIDGVPFASQLIEGGNNILGRDNGSGSFGSPLNVINPSDIESIDILKDADATAIYGSRAANGAILITTKKGKIGDIKINANVQTGWGSVERKLDLMDSHQYMEMRHEALKNDKLSLPKSSDYDLKGVWDTTRNIDWQDELIGGIAKYQDYQASISGGSNTTTYLIGAGYHKEGNVFPGSFTDDKTSFHFNINSASSNQKFKIQVNGSFLQNNNLSPNVDLTSFAMTLAPVTPPLKNNDGSLNWEPDAFGASTLQNNPLAYLDGKFKNISRNLLGNTILSYMFTNDLEFKTSFGYNSLTSDVTTTNPLTALVPEDRPYVQRSSIFANTRISTLTMEPQLSYRKSIRQGQLEVLVGGTIQKETRNGSSVRASGFSTDQVMEDLKSATELTPGFSNSSIYKYSALFGRINYNWKSKYILNLSARRDGSSRFGFENRFHNFGAIGAAWIFSEEGFINKNLRFLSFGKIRGSFGTTGSDQIPNYQFLSLYEAIGGISSPYQGVNGYLPIGLTNPYLQWEETKKLQFGIDLGFFKDRVLLNANYSRNRSSNQLLAYSLPSITGFVGVAMNFPATVQNTGWEFTLSTTNIKTKIFNWNSSFNLTLPENKLINYPGYDDTNPNGQWKIGSSINILKVFNFLGVDPSNGVYVFSDRDGKQTSSPTAGVDNLTIINPDPKFYGGFQNTFSFKGFELGILLQFTKQKAQNYFFGGGLVPGRFNLGLSNQPASTYDRWKVPGDIKLIQRYTTGSSLSAAMNNARNSDAIWSDASYIRLKNVSLSWHVPTGRKSIIPLNNLKIFIQGQNLLTITNYKGLDPESKSSLSLPPLRVLTVGFQMTL